MANHPNRSKANRSLGANPTPAEIRRAREDAGLTQVQMARLLFASERTVQDWESDDPTNNRRMHPLTWVTFQTAIGALPDTLWPARYKAIKEGKEKIAA